MRILYQITDAIIQTELEHAVNECIENGWIIFPDNKSKNDFLIDCVETTLEKIDLYENPFPIDYMETVIDMAKTYNYITEEE